MAPTAFLFGFRDVPPPSRHILPSKKDILPRLRDILSRLRDILSRLRDILAASTYILPGKKDILTRLKDILAGLKASLPRLRASLFDVHSPVMRVYRCALSQAGRELCARFLDGVNEQGLLPGGGKQGKYDVSRQLGFTTENTEIGKIGEPPEGFRLLDAA